MTVLEHADGLERVCKALVKANAASAFAFDAAQR
jgi:hypothetical protein